MMAAAGLILFQWASWGIPMELVRPALRLHCHQSTLNEPLQPTTAAGLCCRMFFLFSFESAYQWGQLRIQHFWTLIIRAQWGRHHVLKKIWHSFKWWRQVCKETWRRGEHSFFIMWTPTCNVMRNLSGNLFTKLGLTVITLCWSRGKITML